MRGEPDVSLGVIEIKPPIKFGEEFSEIVLGKRHRGIELNEVFSDEDATLLLAQTAVYRMRDEKIRNVVQETAGKIELVLNATTTAASLATQAAYQTDL